MLNLAAFCRRSRPQLIVGRNIGCICRLNNTPGQTAVAQWANVATFVMVTS
jgi:hypothetical protein